MKVYAISLVLLFIATDIFSKFYSIKSKIEFDNKISEFGFSFVCFLNSDDFDSQRIKYLMKLLADSRKFGNEHSNKLGFLFVCVENDSLKNVATVYGFVNDPIFLILKSDGNVLAVQDFGKHYYLKTMINFLNDAIHYDLEKDVDYDADVEDFKIAQGSTNELLSAGYVPIELDQEQIYFWNRGGGNSRDGRGGWRYHDNCVSKGHNCKK